MKISVNQKTGRPIIELDRKDLTEANEIERTMESKGWKFIMQYWIVAREAMIQRGKNGSKASTDGLAAARWAALDGFDEGIAIPRRIIERAKEFIQAEKEAKNDATEYDGLSGQ